jgi:hypothetical protein
MSKLVLCIDDKNLPQGASVKEGEYYPVVDEFINALDQRTYILDGVPNEGRTQLGMIWKGYRANRFLEVTGEFQEKKEAIFSLN